jgi:hypothetical protein
MDRMLLLFSHTLTENQKKDAHDTIGITEFTPLPHHLQDVWNNIPPTLPSIINHLDPIKKWMNKTAENGDIVLIQGDFGAVYVMVNYAFSIGAIPVYATTEKKSAEISMSANTVKTERIFEHKIFRRYEQEGKDESSIGISGQ